MPDITPFYVELILPLPLQGTFTYSITEEQKENLIPGMRVLVQFGAKKIYSAIVREIHQHEKTGQEIKGILSVLDDQPIVNAFQFELWDWISSYYQCSLGEVSKAAIPGGLRLESETRLYGNPPEDQAILLPSEISVLNLLEKKPGLSMDEIAGILKKSSVYSLVKSMMDKGLLSANERVNKGFQPKLQENLRLAEEWLPNDSHPELFESLRRSPKQAEALKSFLAKSDNGLLTIRKDEFIQSGSINAAIIKQLIGKKILVLEEKIESRLTKNQTTGTISELNPAQSAALAEIKNYFENKDVVLLHGVTSSGKTELYIHLIREQLEKGNQVLYLLPEIALTTQIIRRLQNIYGNTVGVYHSKFSDAERVETWKNLLNPESPEAFQLILGVRSSLFLPFSKLGLIIVDEEHENTFKQIDPAPRYHARDAAVMLARIHQAKVLLGTGTPSLESYFNFDLGKYGLVKITERFRDIKMPQIEVVDIRIETKKKSMHSHFSSQLVQEIQRSLDNHEQVILFQNRRGFSPYIQCNSCGWVPICKTCDVSLTWHKTQNRLVCHYCGTAYPHLHTCKSCGQSDLRTMGFGTEKIEDEISLLFPSARIARLDLDAARSRAAYERIIHDFEDGKTDILVGTQMISKGLDFDNVKVVGILDADRMLNFPDFRAFERAFQLMEQVSGRAGRKDRQGKVIIQTRLPENRIIRNLIRHDFMAMYRAELLERRRFNYPPFTRLIRITLRHRNADVTESAAERLSTLLKLEFGHFITGPDSPVIGRIQNLYIRNILIKLERDKQAAQHKEKIMQLLETFRSSPENKGVSFSIDVDPM